MFFEIGDNEVTPKRDHVPRAVNEEVITRLLALSESDLYQQHAIASPINTLIPRKHRVRNV